MLSKKAQGYTDEMMFFHIIAMIFAIMFAIAMLWYASSNADLSTFWKSFYAKDIALTMDSAYAVPGSVTMTYRIISPTHRFQYDISEGQVAVLKQKTNEYPTQFNFGKTPRIIIKDPQTNQQIKAPISLYTSFPITKTPTETVFQFQEKPTCNFILTKDVLITQTIYFGSPGTEEQRATNLITRLNQYASYMSIPLAMMPTQSNLAVYAQLQDKNEIDIYYQGTDNTQSEKLVCILQEKLTAAGLTPKLQPFFTNGQFEMLQQKPSILVIYNKEQPENVLFDAITKSIEDYYAN